VASAKENSTRAEMQILTSAPQQSREAS
jgi:hypothetical protein